MNQYESAVGTITHFSFDLVHPIIKLFFTITDVNALHHYHEDQNQNHHTQHRNCPKTLSAMIECQQQHPTTLAIKKLLPKNHYNKVDMPIICATRPLLPLDHCHRWGWVHRVSLGGSLDCSRRREGKKT